MEICGGKRKEQEILLLCFYFDVLILFRINSSPYESKIQTWPYNNFFFVFWNFLISCFLPLNYGKVTHSELSQNPTLEHYTSYVTSDLKGSVLALQELQLNTNGCSLNAIREKYRHQKVMYRLSNAINCFSILSVYFLKLGIVHQTCKCKLFHSIPVALLWLNLGFEREDNIRGRIFAASYFLP